MIGGLGTHVEDVPPAAVARLLKVSDSTQYLHVVLTPEAFRGRQLFMAVLHHCGQGISPVPLPGHLQDPKVCPTGGIWLHHIYCSVLYWFPHIHCYPLPTFLSLLECIEPRPLWKFTWLPDWNFIDQYCG